MTQVIDAKTQLSKPLPPNSMEKVKDHWALGTSWQIHREVGRMTPVMQGLGKPLPSTSSWKFCWALDNCWQALGEVAGVLQVTGTEGLKLGEERREDLGNAYNQSNFIHINPPLP